MKIHLLTILLITISIITSTGFAQKTDQTDPIVNLDSGEITVDNNTFTEPGSYPVTDSSTIEWANNASGNIILSNSAVIDIGQSILSDDNKTTSINLIPEGVTLSQGNLFITGATNDQTTVLLPEQSIVIEAGESALFKEINPDYVNGIFQNTVPTDMIYWGTNITGQLLLPNGIQLDLAKSDPTKANVDTTLLRIYQVGDQLELNLVVGTVYIIVPEAEVVGVVVSDSTGVLQIEKDLLVISYTKQETSNEIQNIVRLDTSTVSWGIDAFGTLMLPNGALINLSESISTASGNTTSVTISSNGSTFALISGSVLVTNNEGEETEVILPYGEATLTQQATALILMLEAGNAIINTYDNKNSNKVIINCEDGIRLPPNEKGYSLFACPDTFMGPSIPLPSTQNIAPTPPGQ